MFRSPSVMGGGIAKGFFLISFGKIFGGGIKRSFTGFYVDGCLNVWDFLLLNILLNLKVFK